MPRSFTLDTHTKAYTSCNASSLPKDNKDTVPFQWCLTAGTLQVIDPHTHQYMDRMKDEPVLLALASKASDYLGGRGEVKSQAKIALRRVEHFYYKTDTVYDAMRRMTIAQQQAQPQASTTEQVPL